MSGLVEIREGKGPLWWPLPFTEAEFERRLDAVRAQMANRGLDAFVSFTPENIYYLTAHDTPGYYYYQACVITQTEGPINVLRFSESSNTLGRSWKRLAVTYGDREDPIEPTLNLLKQLGVATKNVGAEANAWFVSPLRWEQLQRGITRAGGTLCDSSGLVETQRMIKSPEEVETMRRAAQAVTAGMREALAATTEGTNENEVAARTIAELIRNGSEYAGLPPFISSGPRTTLTHATWAGRRYERGDLVTYELPGVVNRYAAALFRTAVIGPPTDDVKRQADMVLECLASVLAAARPGRTCHEVHRANKGVFEKYGAAHLFPGGGVGRTGYSIGINYPPDWGEGHIISLWEGDERSLQPGMTFHTPIGFNIFGKYQLRCSETWLVTDTGCETLTKGIPRELHVVS